ncbi:MAG: glycoside hydrolase 100 family protein [Planctomycetota bacterium]
MPADRERARAAAAAVVEEAIVHHAGVPVGTVAARQDDVLDELNYDQVFVRDCAVSCFWFLMQERYELVREHVLMLARLQRGAGDDDCFAAPSGAMPASIQVDADALRPDYGQRAIARVAPVDSVFWYLLVLRAYVRSGHEPDFVRRELIRDSLQRALDLILAQQLTLYPALFVPEGSFMIDRRLGVYGHPLEIQVLYHGALTAICELLAALPGDAACTDACARAEARRRQLADFVNEHYWLDARTCDRIHHYRSEGYGGAVENPLNLQAGSLSRWLQPWLRDGRGFLAGNVGPGRLDCRFFTAGNLLAAPLGLIDARRGAAILQLLDAQWAVLAAQMPLKICYPAVYGRDWILFTGRDPKNSPWSYHNGGGWPVLLWHLAVAAVQAGRCDLIERALQQGTARLLDDDWPEYYDGEYHDLTGRRARRRQTWSAVAWLIADALLERPELVRVFAFDRPAATTR